MMMTTSAERDDQPLINVASHLRRMAKERPYKRAVICPSGRDSHGRVAYSHLTFLQLDWESDGLAQGLEQAGIRRNTRTILMVKPSLEFFVLIFALFKIGAVPVVVDPGMGIRRMLACYQTTRPQAFIGIPLAHAVRVLFPRFFKTVKSCVTVGSRWFWRGCTLEQLRKSTGMRYPIADTHRDDMAAILFTTGSTGPAKGTVYTHGNFDAQLRQIQSHLNVAADEIDLSTFPLFALFYPALGVTAVIPDMDPTRPAQVNPERIIEAVLNQGVTNMFASPALLDRVGRYGRQREIRLPSLKRVISAGAPVSADNIERFSALLAEDAEIHTPYGATEAVPIVSITGKEILGETRSLTEQGYGICIGRPINHTVVRIIRIHDHRIENWTDDLLVSPGEVGEITVKADLVSRQYYDNPQADALAKIADRDGFWHRMGDLGWMDSRERIWFCGRKSHRVVTKSGTLFTIPCEAIFNTHPQVYRSALVGVGPRLQQTPVICIQPDPAIKAINPARLRTELLEMAGRFELTRDIQTILFRKTFPVDIRHNSKIFREKLSTWAAKKLL